MEFVAGGFLPCAALEHGGRNVIKLMIDSLFLCKQGCTRQRSFIGTRRRCNDKSRPQRLACPDGSRGGIAEGQRSRPQGRNRRDRRHLPAPDEPPRPPL